VIADQGGGCLEERVSSRTRQELEVALLSTPVFVARESVEVEAAECYGRGSDGPTRRKGEKYVSYSAHTLPSARARTVLAATKIGTGKEPNPAVSMMPIVEGRAVFLARPCRVLICA
jgi:hypothetical protein